MTRIYRLSRADFASLRPFYKDQGRFFVLTIAKSPDNKPKFACVVSKKTARKAHERNLIKRRCRVAIREIPSLGAFALIFTAKRSVLTAGHEEVFADVASLIVKAKPSLMSVSELQ
jgi:ribonuclease P protein component